MTSQNSPSLLDKISSLCDDKSSFQARFALASSSQSSPSSIIVEKGLMLFEYLQLASQLLIATLMLNFNKDSALFQAAFFLARLVNPAFWMSFDKNGTLENTLLTFVCIFTVAKLLLFLYILWICIRNRKLSGKLVTFWRILMKFQSRITYFYVSSFYIAAIRVVNWERYQNTDNQDMPIKMTAYVLIIFELFLALIPKTCYHYMLPTKSFLSSKENTLEIMTLVQKVITQILTGTLHSSIPGYNWILAIVNIFIDIGRISNFFVRLPFYQFRSLYFQGWLLIMIASLNLSYFVTQIIKEIDSDSQSIGFSLVLWVILLVFGINVSNNFLKKAYWRIICDPALNSPNLLIHRVVAIKELTKSTVLSSEENLAKNHFKLLLLKTLNSHIKRNLWAQDEKDDLLSVNILCKNFLEKLQDKFPKNKFIKIFLAEFYFKHLKVYGDPIKICLNLQQSRDIKLRINAQLLLIRIQNQAKNKSKNLDHFTQLDLLNFVSEHTFVAKLKQQMLKQTALQIKICSEIMSETPHLEAIYQNSQKAQSHRINITKEINKISTKLHDYNIESMILSSEYAKSLNHSVADFIHFTKLSSQKRRKYQKLFSQEKLCPENVFQEDVSFVMISGVKGEAGKIIYATKQFGNIVGGDPSQFPGAFFTQKAAPILRPMYNEGWKELSENTETGLFGRMTRGFLHHIDGYLVEIDYFCDIHPFTTQGFSFVLIIRPVVSNREYFLLYENGDIDSATKGLIEKLGIKPQAKRINIADLNKNLGQVNEAFNFAAFPQKYEESDHAKEIYSKYSTEGARITLKSQLNPELNYSYNCKITNMVFGPVLIKTLTFEENKKENRTLEQLLPRSMNYHVPSENFFTEKQDSPELQSETDRTDTQRDRIRNTDRPLITSHSHINKKNPSKFFINTLKKLDNPAETLPADLPRLYSSSSDSYDEDHQEVYRQAKTNRSFSEITHEKRISSVFHVSLNAKYYSKTFKAMTVTFYMAILILTILKLFVKVTSENDMASLVTKKDIFSNNGYRSLQLIEVSNTARYIWQFTSGALNLSDYSVNIQRSFNTTRNYVFLHIEELRETNKKVAEASTILQGEFRDAVYEKNVKIYNTYFDAAVQSYTLMDSLQATDRIIETALSVYYSFFETVVTEEMVARAEFLFRNSLNDLIVTNAQLSNSMLSSVNEQISVLRTLSTDFMGIFIAVLVVVFCLFAFFLWKQYKTEVFFISAVSKLSHSKVQAVHKEFINFQKYLKQQDDSSIEEITRDRNLMRSLKTRDETSISMSTSRREFVKYPEKKALRKRYLKQIFLIAVLLFIFIAAIVINAVNAAARFNKIDSVKEKLYFINHTRIRTALASTTLRELLATNNMAYVENRKTVTELELLSEQLVTIRTKIYSMLLTEEMVAESPEIETILLGEGCSLLGSEYEGYCGSLQRRGIGRGFVYLLNAFEGYWTGKVEAYENSDKSETALEEIQVNDYNIRAVIYLVAMAEIDYLWEIMNEQFEASVEDDAGGRKSSLVLFFTVVTLISVVGWKYLLKELRESVNKFKNILRVFPAGLVLANFTLKRFLMKTSKEGIEYLRTEV